MKNNHRKYLFVMLVIATVGIVTLGWTGNNQNRSFQSHQDTVPSRQKGAKAPSKDSKKDFDKEINELDRAMGDIKGLPDIDLSKMQAEITASMNKLNEELARHNVDLEKMQKELNLSLSNLNSEKMQADLNRSLKTLDKIDVEKLQKELKESLSNINDDEFKLELKNSLKELDRIDVEKMKKEIGEALSEVKVNVNAEEINRKVQESLQNVDMGKIKLDMEKMGKEMEKNKMNMKLDMDDIHKDLEKARKELKGYQEMVYEMEKDGLLKTNEDYSIEYKQGELSINGKKQSASVTNKYKKYFSKDGITIKKLNGEMNINIQ